MDTRTVECLGCGATRLVPAAGERHVVGGECPRCGYVGWALSADMSERLRRLLRDRPLERRRIRAA